MNPLFDVCWVIFLLALLASAGELAYQLWICLPAERPDVIASHPRDESEDEDA